MQRTQLTQKKRNNDQMPELPTSLDIIVILWRYVGDKQGSFLKNTLRKANGAEDNVTEDEKMFGTLYKTGDFARIVNGRLYYEGRLDAQVFC